MNCKNCGAKLNPTDTVCNNCNYPVEYTPYAPVEKVSEVKKIKKEKYTNYGEPQKAITSFKFLLPIALGIVVIYLIFMGVSSAFRTILEDNKKEIVEDPYFKIEYANFTYEVPNEFTYSKSNSLKTLFLHDENKTITIEVLPITYTNLKKKQTSILAYLTRLGYNTEGFDEEMIGGVTYLKLDAMKKEKHYMFLFSKAKDTGKCFAVSIYPSTQIDSSYLKKISTILNSASYQAKNEEVVDYHFEDVVK